MTKKNDLKYISNLDLFENYIYGTNKTEIPINTIILDKHIDLGNRIYSVNKLLVNYTTSIEYLKDIDCKTLSLLLISHCLLTISLHKNIKMGEYKLNIDISPKSIFCIFLSYSCLDYTATLTLKKH